MRPHCSSTLLVGRIMRQYAEADEPTLFGLMQAGTRVWHDLKQTASSWAHIDALVTGLVEYANERLG